MIRNNLLFIRAKVSKQHESFFADFIDYFNDELLSRQNLLLQDKIKVFPYHSGFDNEFLLAIPLVLLPPFFFWPISLVFKSWYFLIFLLRSRFRLGFRPVFNRVVAEVLYDYAKNY